MVEEILVSRYYRKGENSWGDVCNRVSRAIGNNLEEVGEFYNLLSSFDFLPNSPTLMNAGTDIGQLSACFVLPVEDSMEGIFDAVKWTALIHKSGGGTGFNFSHLRPAGTKVGSTDGIASGPISFMRVFNEATETVKQGGRRRGANMGILRYDHPDIWDFIKVKEKEGSMANFNLSVMVDDKFMESVFNGTNKENSKLFDAIIDGMWNNGEPSLLFYDAINRDNPIPELGQIEATNPCGEQPLLPFESCNLGSINLVNMLNEKYEIDYDKLRKTVYLAVRFLNNVIDKNNYTIPQIGEVTRRTRKIGLGYMGFADMLILMGISYNSKEAVELAGELMKFITESALIESRSLSVNSPSKFTVKFGGDIWVTHNSALTCIAPTGSVSLLAQCSSGIEPVFSFVMKRKNTVNKEFFVVNKVFEKIFRACLYPEKYDELVKECYEKGSIQHVKWIDEDLRKIFVSSMDISGQQQIDIVASAQKYCQAGISKTVNWPSNTTREEIAYACVRAWQHGCKGITNYREGSRKDAVLTLKDKEEAKPVRLINHHKPFTTENGETRLLPKRPRTLYGMTEKWRSGCGKLLISLGELESHPYEVIITSEGGGCAAMSNALGKMISLALRWNVPATDIVRTLKGVTCGVALKNPKSEGKSCAAIVGRFLESAIPDTETETKAILGIDPAINKPKKALCPDCGSVLAMEEGCRKCHICGWSKC